MTVSRAPKPIVWVGAARQELKALPRDVQRAMGTALWFAQHGQRHPSASLMRGPRLAGVMEVREDYNRATYRLMYVAALGNAIYVLAAFQKKAVRGIATPTRLLDRVALRLRQARTIHDQKGRTAMSGRSRPEYESSTGNIFADLGFEHPEEELAKADLIRQIVQLVRDRGITQMAAGKLMGLPQSTVSLLFRGRTAGFSTDRLFRFLNRLGQDIDIVVRANPSASRRARLRVRRHRRTHPSRRTKAARR